MNCEIMNQIGYDLLDMILKYIKYIYIYIRHILD